MNESTKSIPTEYRCYVFVNSLFKSVWKGVQATHAVVELFNSPQPADITLHWAKYDTTLIVLDAGNNADLIGITSEITRLGNKLDLPVAHFNEDVVTMGGLLTSSCIIVPNAIYDNEDFNEFRVNSQSDDLKLEYIDTSYEAQLYRVLKSCRLAS